MERTCSNCGHKLCRYGMYDGITCTRYPSWMHVSEPNKHLCGEWKKEDNQEAQNDWDNEEVWNAIYELSDIRARYSVFNEEECKKYRACSLAIKALRELIGE